MSDEFESWIINALNNKHIQQFKYEVFKHPRDFAEGGFAKIKNAGWPYSNRKVVLKKLINYDIQKFVKEVKMHISCHWSEHVVRFFGLTKEIPGEYIMIMEYAELQSLQKFLKNEDNNISWKTKYKLSLDIARGLSCLHSCNIIHCDLHTDNIVIKQIHRKTECCPSEYIAQITDFGDAILLNEGRIDKGVFGKVEFMDPAHLDQPIRRTRNETSDIYSMGVIFWTISSGKMPFENYMGDFQNRTLQLTIDIMYGKRENVPDSTPKSYSQLYTTCWSGVPTERPTLERIIKVLEVLDQTNDISVNDVTIPIDNSTIGSDNKSDTITDELKDYQNFEDCDVKHYYS